MKLNDKDTNLDVMLCILNSDTLSITIQVDENNSYENIKKIFFDKEQIAKITDNDGNEYINYTTVKSISSTIDENGEIVKVELKNSDVKDELKIFEEQVQTSIDQIMDALVEMSEIVYK